MTCDFFPIPYTENLKNFLWRRAMDENTEHLDFWATIKTDVWIGQESELKIEQQPQSH